MHRSVLIAAIAASLFNTNWAIGIDSDSKESKLTESKLTGSKLTGTKAAQFFENKVRPLLVQRCFECDNEDSQESELRLDSLQFMLDGGLRGPAISPGDSKNSLLIHAVNHSEADLQMPEGEKLAAGEIKLLTEWIDNGAVWPGQSAEIREFSQDGGPVFTEDDKSFWAFLPPKLPQPPDVQDESWIQSELDRFILAKLEARQLKPAPPAEKRDLLRRVYFDLIGLPPTPEQLEAFVNDQSPTAFETGRDFRLTDIKGNVVHGVIA